MTVRYRWITLIVLAGFGVVLIPAPWGLVIWLGVIFCWSQTTN